MNPLTCPRTSGTLSPKGARVKRQESQLSPIWGKEKDEHLNALERGEIETILANEAFPTPHRAEP